MSKDPRRKSVWRMPNRRVELKPTDEGCPMHGPWKLKFRKYIKDLNNEAYTGVETTTENFGDCGMIVETEFTLSDQAMRGIVGMYMKRQALRTVDALWNWITGKKEEDDGEV